MMIRYLKPCLSPWICRILAGAAGLLGALLAGAAWGWRRGRAGAARAQPGEKERAEDEDQALAAQATQAKSEFLASRGRPARTPGGRTPGARTPGGRTPGGRTPGARTPGGRTPGGRTPAALNVGRFQGAPEGPDQELPGAAAGPWDRAAGNRIRRTQHFVRMLAHQLQHHPRFSGFLSDQVVDLLFQAAPLHDLGRAEDPGRLPRQPGPDPVKSLPPQPVRGLEAIEAADRQLAPPLAFLDLAKAMAGGHHERWDGTGFPLGLRGDAIPIPARLMAVAGSYDELISRQDGGPGLAHAEAVRVLAAGRGSRFDPAVLDAFLRIAEGFRAVATRFPG